MKECFIPKKFQPADEKQIGVVNGIISTYAAQGYTLTLRQLYYQLVARDLIPNNERSYKNTGRLVSEARLAGRIDWDMIEDRARTSYYPQHWDSPAEIVRACADSIRVDLWQGQDNYVEVMVEKQALEGILEPVCNELDIRFSANKGYSSSSAIYNASKRFQRAKRQGKTCHVLYLGDHDPSGIDMSRDVLERLWLMTGFRAATLDLNRLALNMDQIEELDPPENPAKITDSRAKSYIAKYGNSSWELDAIEPAALAKLVRDAVAPLIQKRKMAERRKLQKQYRTELTKYADEYGQK